MNIFAITRSPFFWIFLGGLCYYAALPPLNVSVLAFAVPICWGIVVRDGGQQTADGSKHKRSGSILAAVYCTALLFWLASIWWIACPHPLTALGLLALSAFLSLYWLLFFVSARVAVHRFRIPLLVAMPVCWIGTEYLRCHVLGGFSFCALEHAFYRYPLLIQLASLGGSFLVGGMIMFVGAAILTCFSVKTLKSIFASSALTLRPLRSENLPQRTQRIRKERKETIYSHLRYILLYPKWRRLVIWNRLCGCLSSLIIFLIFLWAIIAIITTRTTNEFNPSDYTNYSIIALQGNRQVHLHTDREAAEAEANNNFKQFVDLTRQTIHDLKQQKQPLPDVIVFPETVCPIPAFAFEGTLQPTVNEEGVPIWETEFRQFVQQIETPMIFGVSTLVFKDDPEKPQRRLNSALLVEPQQGDKPGNVYRYDKMHLVMFGEYIPFAEYLPEDFILRTLCPEAHHGNTPMAFPIAQRHGKTIEASINICFESSVAHLIRKQILTLRKRGHNPRVLINLSNDGWFRFSQQIEQHLATHVFRAVENGMWYVTATNGGYSAIINPWGGIEHIGKRGEAEAVAGRISVLQDRVQTTIYQRYGDWYALMFAVIVLGLTGITLVKRKKPKIPCRTQADRV